MKTRLWMVVPALAASALLGACSDGAGVAGPAEGQDPLIDRLVEMGARRDQIADRGDHFVVEGDIRVNKKDLRAPRPPAEAEARPGGARYQRYDQTVAVARRTVRVNLAAVDAENSSWAAATRAAMSNWNSVSGVDLTFVEGGTADITVSFVNSLGSCVTAQGAFPSAGAPGATVQISRAYAGSYGYDQQVWVMTHELGHNVGMAHTDGTFGNLIPGTPTFDAGSVMNSGATYGGCPPVAPNWSGFSFHDQVAANWLYPRAPVVSVSDSGGTPLVSWGALSGATSYTVSLIHYVKVTSKTEPSWSEEYVEAVGTTSGTSILDSARIYTGTSACLRRFDSYTTRSDTWRYRVVASFPNGGSSALVGAPVGECAAP